jgi:hypothetical protein
MVTRRSERARVASGHAGSPTGNLVTCACGLERAGQGSQFYWKKQVCKFFLCQEYSAVESHGQPCARSLSHSRLVVAGGASLSLLDVNTAVVSRRNSRITVGR